MTLGMRNIYMLHTMTDRAHRLKRTFNTSMLLFSRYCHAGITFHTMKEINAQSFSNATNVTMRTMINIFVWIIFPEFAYITIIPRQLLTTRTVCTCLCYRLKQITVHTQHIASGISTVINTSYFHYSSHLSMA